MGNVNQDRDIKRFQMHTNDGRVDLNLCYVGMMEYYCVWGQVNSKHFSKTYDKASDAYDEYNRMFIDAKAEAAALLIKATGAYE